VKYACYPMSHSVPSIIALFTEFTFEPSFIDDSIVGLAMLMIMYRILYNLYILKVCYKLYYISPYSYALKNSEDVQLCILKAAAAVVVVASKSSSSSGYAGLLGNFLLDVREGNNSLERRTEGPF
ncbi:hypothetical protein DOY81_002031, partial [Sarcophaga bullata]